MKRKLTAAIGVAALVTTAAACGTGDDGSGGGDSDELTVWLMEGSAPDAWVADLNEAFEEEHGVEVTVEIQQWNDIQSRVTTALSENGTVDVLELGNTQTPAFSRTGGLADLGELSDDLGYDEWFDGLADSAEHEGDLYAVPWYTANRAVVYDQDIWEEAGAEIPQDRVEFLAALETIENSTDAEPIYLPGQSYAALSGFIWDEGGDFAVETGDGEWEGAMNTPQARAGFEFYEALYEFSDAPADVTEAEPQQSTEIVPERSIATWIGLPWEAENALEALEEAGEPANLGYFPIPGKSADAPGSVWAGGSNLAVSERAGNPEMAEEWLQMATSPEWMEQFVEQTPALPNQPDAVPDVEDGSFIDVMDQAADSAGFPPLASGWANVEVEPNPIREMMAEVLGGADYDEAAARADEEITDRINED